MPNGPCSTDILPSGLLVSTPGKSTPESNACWYSGDGRLMRATYTSKSAHRRVRSLFLRTRSATMGSATLKKTELRAKFLVITEPQQCG